MRINQGLEQLGDLQAFGVQKEGQLLSSLLSARDGRQFIFVILALFALICLLACITLGFLAFRGRTLGWIIESAIEKHDKELIGVDVTFAKDGLEVSLYQGKVWMKDLTVKNPDPYEAPYLLKVKEVLIDINVSRLLLSRFKHLEFQRVVFKEVDVIWEKSGLTHSNIKQTIEFMEAREAREKEMEEKEEEIADAQSDRDGKKLGLGLAVAAGAAAGARTIVEIDALEIKDVGVKFASHILHGAGMRLSLADIMHDGFAKKEGARLAHDVIHFLMLTFLKTVVTNTMGKTIGDHMF